MLRQLVLNKRKGQKLSLIAELDQRRAALDVRAAGLAAAIEEAKTEEEIVATEAEVAEIEAEAAEIETKKGQLQGEIEQVEAEIAQLEANDPKPAAAPAPVPGDSRNTNTGGMIRMRANRFFREMPVEQRSALLARDEVKQFLTRTRELLGQKRAVSGAELTIQIGRAHV